MCVCSSVRTGADLLEATAKSVRYLIIAVRLCMNILLTAALAGNRNGCGRSGAHRSRNLSSKFSDEEIFISVMICTVAPLLFYPASFRLVEEYALKVMAKCLPSCVLSLRRDFGPIGMG